MTQVRAISLAFGRKVEATVGTSASSPVLVAVSARPIQVRLCNRDTVPVAFRFGGPAVAASLTTDPVLPAGAVEVVTVASNSRDGSIYMSVIGDSGGSSGKFEATPGQGL